MTKDIIRKILIISMILGCVCVSPFNLIRKESTLYPEFEVPYGVSDDGVQELGRYLLHKPVIYQKLLLTLSFLNKSQRREVCRYHFVELMGMKEKLL
jgi:hypothetical protein